MNSSREGLARWAEERWFQSGEHSTEARLEEILSWLGMGIKDVTVELRQRASRPQVQFPWPECVQQAAGKQVAAYVDASSGEHDIDQQMRQEQERDW